MTHEEEVSLLKRLVARDEKALHQLILTFRHRLLACARHQGADTDLAHEIANSVFFEIWQKADSFIDQGCGVVPWLFMLTKRRTIDAFRKNRSHTDIATTSLPESEESETSSFDVSSAVGLIDMATPESELIKSQTQFCFDTCLSTLPSEQKSTLQALLFNGDTTGEISKRMGVEESTVKSRKRLAIEKMTLCVSGCLEGKHHVE
jgi:RNA polymerase sigma factor (sigma-70 family)